MKRKRQPTEDSVDSDVSEGLDISLEDDQQSKVRDCQLPSTVRVWNETNPRGSQQATPLGASKSSIVVRTQLQDFSIQTGTAMFSSNSGVLSHDWQHMC